MTPTAERQQLYRAYASAALLLITGVILSLMGELGHRERTRDQAQVQAQILASSISAALAFDDMGTIRQYLNALRADRQIAAAAIYGDDGRLVMSYFAGGVNQSPPPRPGAPGVRWANGAATVVEPVREQQTHLGAVYLRSAAEPLSATLRRHGALAALVLMAILIAASLTRAAFQLRRRARELAAANELLKIEMEERVRAEEALRQSQKMESLGQLTGGVAHDFNNLLTIIMGGLETIGRLLPPAAESPKTARLHRSRDMAMQGAERAATLTQRLLAFSRRQPLEPAVIDVNKMVAGMAELLRRTLGETIELETVLGGGSWRAKADVSQLENALINLAVNARDAMVEGGKLTIETSNAFLDESYTRDLPEALEPGQYVTICVTDTGAGMDSATLEHVFEPFFTTKEVGRGTGLGLSQVYGFLRQSSGHVKIYSEVGQGTTVKIYLPRCFESEDRPAEPAQLDPAVLSGDETILMVEDHSELRTYGGSILRELGYRVLEAEDGPSALALLEQGEHIDLLFTDVVLPGGANGRQLAEEVARRRPGLKVLYTSGYTRNAIVHNGMLDPGVNLISKPFNFTDLASKVRRVLDAPASQAREQPK